MKDKNLTYKEASELTGIPLGTLYSLVFKKSIPHMRLGRRFVRFSKHKIEKWMKSHEIEAEVQNENI